VTDPLLADRSRRLLSAGSSALCAHLLVIRALSSVDLSVLRGAGILDQRWRGCPSGKLRPCRTGKLVRFSWVNHG
jgi:hypothetical protein